MGYSPENNSIATSLRSIDLSVDADGGNIRQWFFTHDDMNQFLCALKVSVYAEPNGAIKDQDGDIVGLWYFAEFSCKYPDFNHDTRRHPVELTGVDLPPLTDDEADQLADMADDDNCAEYLPPEDDSLSLSGSDNCSRCGDPFCMGDCYSTGAELLAEDEAMGVFAHPSGVYIPSDCDEAIRLKSDAIEAQIAVELERAQSELSGWGKALNREVLEDISTPEDVRQKAKDAFMSASDENAAMAEAGMTDEEIATANHIEAIGNQLVEARNTVASLLGRIDNLCGADLHCLGSTPSWYVEAAAISCGINLGNNDEPCTEPSCVNERKWAKRREIAAAHRGDIKVAERVRLTFGVNQSFEDHDEEEESPSDQLIAQRFLNSELFRDALKRQKDKIDELSRLPF